MTKPKVVQADVLRNEVIVAFDDGTSGIISADTLLDPAIVKRVTDDPDEGEEITSDLG